MRATLRVLLAVGILVASVLESVVLF
jgi:hypothetical protein